MYKSMSDDHIVNRIKYIRRTFNGIDKQRDAGLFDLMAEATLRRIDGSRFLSNS